jgi:DNA-binding MarR family transcriptional regulator
VSEREQSAYRLAKLIKKVRRQMSAAIRTELEPIGISLPVVQIIKAVSAGGGLNQLELAQEIELEPAALSRLLADLEAQRLVTRRRDAGDKRCLLIAATAAGSALMARAQPRVLAGVDALFSRLTRAEHGQLCYLLERLASDEATPASGPSRAPVSRLPIRTAPRSRRPSAARDSESTAKAGAKARTRT